MTTSSHRPSPRADRVSSTSDVSSDPPPIMLSRCPACGAHASLTPAACPRCGGALFEAVAATGRGVVRARSEVWRAPDSFWKAYVPYTLVLVRLEEGPTIMGHAEASIAIGDPVLGSTTNRADRRVLEFQYCPLGESAVKNFGSHTNTE